jgi:hypothetical protein
MTRRLIAADVLKLVRRRGQMTWALLLTVGPILIGYGVTEGYHLSDVARYGAAGGARNLENALWLILMLGGAAAAVLGTSAGIGDQTAGVFRELVVTGRSRLALFAARGPAALIVFLPMVLAAYAVAAACTFALADGLPTPSPATVALDAIWVVAIASVQLLFAVGFAALVGSRATAVGVLVAWQLAVSPLLLSVDQLGVVRELVPRAAELRLQPVAGKALGFGMAPTTAVAVLVLWTVVLLAAGARRTVRIDA